VVVGLARTGVATARFLLERGAGVLITDQKSANQLGEGVKRLKELPAYITQKLTTELGGHKPASFIHADLIVLSPGVSPLLEAVKAAREAGVEVISEVELAYRHLKGKIIGITGTNGKTTVTELIGHIFRSLGCKTLVAGNIGEPLIAFTDQADEDTWLVTELSSFQLEMIQSFRCHIALLLNISPDHLDRHASMEQYIEAKSRIFMNQNLEDWAILNAGDPQVQDIARQLVSKAVTKPLYFSTKPYQGNGFVLDGDWISYRRDGELVQMMRRADIPLKGNHNIENVMAALAVCLIRMLDPSKVVKAIRSFSLPEHRLEWCGRINGIEAYNDSKATNVDACIKALEAFDAPIALILGGRNKGLDFQLLRSAIAGRVKQVCAIGESAEEIHRALSDLVPVEICDSMRAAVELGVSRGKSGEILLLAPACASFDMFEDYRQRGQVFKEEIRRLQKMTKKAAEK